MSAERKIRRFVDTLFLPANAVQRGTLSLSSSLLALVIFIILLFAIFSLPMIQELFWEKYYSSSERIAIIAKRGYLKSWYDSLSFTLDLLVALLIGGSIFGEKLAKSFQNSIIKYEKAREALLTNELDGLNSDVELSIKSSIEKITKFRTGTKLERLKHFWDILNELRNIYHLAFKDVPAFYKGYIRFVFYSSFPGGLYGLLAFFLFFMSSGFKLGGIYLDSPFLGV